MRDQLCSKGCSTRWALIRELWKGEANPKATVAASNLHRLYGQTVRNDAAPSKRNHAQGLAQPCHGLYSDLQDLHFDGFIHCFYNTLQYISFTIHCLDYNAFT